MTDPWLIGFFVGLLCGVGIALASGVALLQRHTNRERKRLLFILNNIHRTMNRPNHASK